MHFSTYLSTVTALASVLVTAAPQTDGLIQVEPDLRLIKTSETDPGTWVTEEEKIEKYVSKKINFIDITDITVRILLIMTR